MRSEFVKRLFDNWLIKVLALAAAATLYFYARINAADEMFITIDLNVILNGNYVPVETYEQSIDVKLTGIDLTGVNENAINAVCDFSSYESEGVYEEPVAIEIDNHLKNKGISVSYFEPKLIQIKLEKKLTKSVPVVMRRGPAPPPGYNLVDYFITPTTVEIEGPRSIVESIDSVETEEIDMSNKTENFTIKVRVIMNNPLVKFRTSDIVEFTGTIEEVIEIKTFSDVPISVIGLDPNFRVSSELPPGRVKLQAKASTLRSMTRQDINLYVDCSSITRPGTQYLRVQTDIPSEAISLDLEPSNIEFTVTEKEQTQ